MVIVHLEVIGIEFQQTIFIKQTTSEPKVKAHIRMYEARATLVLLVLGFDGFPHQVFYCVAYSAWIFWIDDFCAELFQKKAGDVVDR